MGIDERARHDLYQQLEQALGEEATATLMSYLPPVGWADVAPRTDLDHLRVAGTADLDRLGAEMRGEMAVLGNEMRGEMAVLGNELRGEMAVLGNELRGEMAVLGNEIERLRGDFHRDLAVQTRTLIFSMLGAIIGLGTLALGVSQIV